MNAAMNAAWDAARMRVGCHREGLPRGMTKNDGSSTVSSHGEASLTTGR